MSDLLDPVQFDDSGYTNLADGWYVRDGNPELTDRAHYVRDGRLTGVRIQDAKTFVVVAAQDGVILSVHRDDQGGLDILARRADGDNDASSALARRLVERAAARLVDTAVIGSTDEALLGCLVDEFQSAGIDIWGIARAAYAAREAR